MMHVLSESLTAVSQDGTLYGVNATRLAEKLQLCSERCRVCDNTLTCTMSGPLLHELS